VRPGVAVRRVDGSRLCAASPYPGALEFDDAEGQWTAFKLLAREGIVGSGKSQEYETWAVSYIRGVRGRVALGCRCRQRAEKRSRAQQTERAPLGRLTHRAHPEMTTDRQLLEQAYGAFNARDVDAALATMDPDVIWPNVMEGGHVYGHIGVRECWLGQ